MLLETTNVQNLTSRSFIAGRGMFHGWIDEKPSLLRQQGTVPYL